ncbi:MAG: hypothetical protein ACHP6I_01150, partial [Rickettsiales bacterium]
VKKERVMNKKEIKHHVYSEEEIELHYTNAKKLFEEAVTIVAFYFDKKGNCQHGARYLETLTDISLNRWTSKLGSSITVAHDLDDLLGENSIYGNELHYASCLAKSFAADKSEL